MLTLYILNLARRILLDNLQHMLRATLLLNTLLSGSKPGGQELLLPTPTTNDGINLDPTPTRAVIVTADTTLIAVICWVVCVVATLGLSVGWLLWHPYAPGLDNGKYVVASLGAVPATGTTSEADMKSRKKVKMRPRPVSGRRQRRVRLLERSKQCGPRKSQVNAGSAWSLGSLPVIKLLTWYSPAAVDESSLPAAPSVEEVKADDMGFYFSSADIGLLDAFVRERYVLAWKIVYVSLGDASATLILRMLFTHEGAHPDDAPTDCAVFLPLVAAHDQEALFKAWLGDHFVGIGQPGQMVWSDYLVYARSVGLQLWNHLWDWEVSATLDAIDAALAGQDGPCAEAEVGVDDSGLEDEHYGYHGEDEADNVWDGGEETDGYYPDGDAAYEHEHSGQGSAYDALLAALDDAIAMHDGAGTDMQHGVDDGGYEDEAQGCYDEDEAYRSWNGSYYDNDATYGPWCDVMMGRLVLRMNIWRENVTGFWVSRYLCVRIGNAIPMSARNFVTACPNKKAEINYHAKPPQQASGSADSEATLASYPGNAAL
ncbi:predicted protein [Postia placenta Mad-698-R]|nr:predicted protein [Postia placenta Mad-698-R]